MKPQVYDSGDPNLPNLPDTDQYLWSDYDDYLSGHSSVSNHSDVSDSEDDEKHRRKKNNQRGDRDIGIGNGSNVRVRGNSQSNHKIRRKSFLARINSNAHRKSSSKSQKRSPLLNSSRLLPNYDMNRPTIVTSDEDDDDHDHGNEAKDNNNKLNVNSRNRKGSNETYTRPLTKIKTNASRDSGRISTKERAGSVFSMLHLPLPLSPKSASASTYKGRSRASLDHSDVSVPNTPIIQPTRSHSVAAGGSGTSDVVQRVRSHHSFSRLPPRVTDEEMGPDELYMDRDVSYAHHNDGAGDEADDDDDDDDDYRDDEEGEHEDEHDHVSEVYSHGRSRRSSSPNRVEIDDRPARKIMGTDTDYESDYSIPENAERPPQSILRKSKSTGTISGISHHNGQSDDEGEVCHESHIDDMMEHDDVDHDAYCEDEADESEVEVEDGEADDDGAPVKPTKKSKKKRSSRRRRRKSRKYAGSQSKKVRTAWEPGIDLRTTNVFLNSPGSIITITDYSKTRYRISHYDLYSEMHPKYSNFTEDDTILSGHDFNEAYEENSPEFNEYIEYMNKVGDSHYEVEEAIKFTPSWSQVRWINVNGLSWEAISIIGKKYNLHPLSVEDLVDIPQRTKLDIYQQHLFVVMPLMKLLKVKKYSDDTEDSYFDRVRKKIRGLSLIHI